MMVERGLKVQYECEPGVEFSVRKLNGDLACYHRVNDWRGVIVRKAPRKREGK